MNNKLLSYDISSLFVLCIRPASAATRSGHAELSQRRQSCPRRGRHRGGGALTGPLPASFGRMRRLRGNNKQNKPVCICSTCMFVLCFSPLGAVRTTVDGETHPYGNHIVTSRRVRGSIYGDHKITLRKMYTNYRCPSRKLQNYCAQVM